MTPTKPKSKLFTSIILVFLSCLSLGAEAQYRPPKPEQTVRVSLGQGLTGADLERLKIGHQAGVLKVIGGDGSTVKFIKGGESLAGSGIDGREWAPLTPAQRDQILLALRVKDPEALARSLMAKYTQISRAHALALLGVLSYPGQETPSLSQDLRAKVLQFQRNRLQPHEDNMVRRQAVLALAIQPKVDVQTVDSMLNFLRRDQNAWNTFGVVQFFDYHQKAIREMPQYQRILTELGLCSNPHAAQIIAGLKQAP